VNLIYLPEVIIFHIKRFAVVGKKITKHCEFPFEIDMSSYQSQESNIEGLTTKYSLIALAEHVGSSETSGHYTAHTCRSGRWYKFDDEHFSEVREKEVL